MVRRHSEKREKILEVLKNGHGAYSASMIHKKLHDIDLATIYRNLELFVAEGDIKKINLGSGESLYEFAIEHHHHAVCSDCNKVIHFAAPENKIRKILNLKDFDPDTIEITIKGRCRHNK